MIKNLNDLLLKRLNVLEYNINSQWLIGFIEAEGSFNGKEGEQASFSLCQHTADANLMRAIIKFIGFVKLSFRVEKTGSLVTSLIAVYWKMSLFLYA